MFMVRASSKVKNSFRRAALRHLIFRTSWVYAARGDNFARTVLRLAQERERLTVVDDQFGAPTGADLLADVSAHAIRQVMKRPANSGLYHLVAGGETSWCGYAKHVLTLPDKAQSAIKIKAPEVTPVLTSASLTLARRPHNSRLDTRKLQDTFGLTLPNWRQGVDRMLNEIFERGTH